MYTNHIRSCTPRFRSIRRICTGLGFLTTLVVAQAPASASCNCTCDAIVPSSQQINAVLMNESGQGPTHHVTASGPMGAAREIRHANLFNGGITITHVCIALQSPTGQPSEPGIVQIAQPDPNNFGLPGTIMHQTNFLINPGFNGHQIVQLTTPQTMTQNFWLVVAYPTAMPAVPHQGVRPRTQLNSAVYVAPPGAGTGWRYYDNATGAYVGAAPIIRALNIGASGSSACPYSQQCCTTVCNLQPSCCINWSPLCEQLAMTQCFTGGCATCPSSGVNENEPCGTDINGGCDTNGNFSNLLCDTITCGTLWRNPATGSSDTDWYAISVTDTDASGYSFFTFNVESEVSVEVTLQNMQCPGHLLHVTYTADSALACIPKSFGGAVPSPGTYWISVRSTGLLNNCPQSHRYTLWVTVDDCSAVAAPANNNCANAGLVLLNPGAYTFDNTGATTDGPAEPCGFTGTNDADLWYTFIAPCSGTARLELVAPYDPLLAVYTACPQIPGSMLIACGAGGGAGGPTAIVSFSTVAGQVYIVRTGGRNGGHGVATLDIAFRSCRGDIRPGPWGDCYVGIDDLFAVIQAWGPCNGCPEDLAPLPAGNGVVNIDDLFYILSHWGWCP
jgi:hypothetical protein